MVHLSACWSRVGEPAHWCRVDATPSYEAKPMLCVELNTTALVLSHKNGIYDTVGPMPPRWLSPLCPRFCSALSSRFHSESGRTQKEEEEEKENLGRKRTTNLTSKTTRRSELAKTSPSKIILGASTVSCLLLQVFIGVKSFGRTVVDYVHEFWVLTTRRSMSGSAEFDY